ncbi:MAG: molecular chaperone DnaJ [Candidatus Eremiobacter antarcticus]|nr:molecular chaperone DnaJ [Candidatus Eremiobacteraeota bacterium]MBC5807611.1 molecular chaperone DnaJ [Candidatus Eremiobacteraeota bacterium]PZR61338.1 MAG: molecular chaperone DnaJ [Candidatus Eremiobacter sp. RRmetagenome_bin22]
MPTQRDYYDTLGVPRDASDDDIKRAYRSLARRYHPDVVEEREKPQAAARFREINEAYTVLSDGAKRSQYDRYGRVDGVGSPGAGPFGGQGVGDIFDFFFGGGMGGRAAPTRGSDLRYDLEVDLHDVLQGAGREITFTHMGRCDVCGGNGSADGREVSTCPDCRGTGELRHTRSTAFGQFVTSAPCARCGGTGSVVRDPCKACSGRGRVEREQRVKVKVPAGVEDGMRIRHTGLGEAGDRGGQSGDLYIYVHMAEHEVFQRSGSDLHCETDVSFTQAALGAVLEIEALDGATTLHLPAGTQPGTTFRIPGRGLPKMRGRGRGDLVVAIRVAVPRKLSRKQRQLLEEFAGAGGEEAHDKNFFKKVREALGNE